MAMFYLPLPAIVSFIQILSSSVAILIFKLCGGTVDNLEWSKVKAYALYIVAFVAAIYANMKALSHSNVETVIVFRACTPISVTIVEYLFMDRAWPSVRSCLSLCKSYHSVSISVTTLMLQSNKYRRSCNRSRSILHE